MLRETSIGSPRYKVKSVPYNRRVEAIHTLGSASGPAVCTSTTLWANLMQHIRTPEVAESQIRNILDLTASIRSHVGPSYELLILCRHTY